MIFFLLSVKLFPLPEVKVADILTCHCAFPQQLYLYDVYRVCHLHPLFQNVSPQLAV